ncbi:hypothetical protein GHA01_13440 [Novacetimonas hansenii]|uniref:Uncharacterized protein n=1 Tax=Novacetimonas hansenii TaxID=436 RepID=A0ABQ0SE47_NOVHA|nr:hypothetical protein Gaha_0153_010 [Novacetimonas hansenii JCM 7643]GEC63495.1 hypothetical protein GHA01_13440 [Novacetimonas hansenii]
MPALRVNPLQCLPYPVGTRWQVWIGHYGMSPRLLHGLRDSGIAGGDDHRADSGQCGAFKDVRNHRASGDIRQWFSGQA